MLRRSHHEDCFDVGRQLPIQLGHRELVLEVGDGPQTLQDHGRLPLAGELVVEFARRWEANVILKGLRAISDFEYEFAMAQLNRKLAPDIETIFMMASPEHAS